MMMHCELIIDAGGTKTGWLAADSSGVTLAQFQTPGINIATSTADHIESVITEAMTGLNGIHPSTTWFYGAGCASPNLCEKVRNALAKHLPGEINIASDLLGAARGLLGHNTGIIGILGTGSNSGYYDGNEVTCLVPPMGYILGDEGSGTALGKRLLRDYFRGNMPGHIKEKFHKAFPDTDYTKVVENVYRKPGANAYIASFVPFLKQYEEEPYVDTLLHEGLAEYANLLKTGYGHLNIDYAAFIGGVAYNFLDVLDYEVKAVGIKYCYFAGSLLNQLKEYHCTQKQS